MTDPRQVPGPAVRSPLCVPLAFALVATAGRPPYGPRVPPVQSKVLSRMINEIDHQRQVVPLLLTQVEGFIEVARQGNMRRAAFALSIGQPALTARLQALEEELGTALFRRTHSGMVLTPAGRAFLPHADRAMEAIRSGGSLVRELEHGVIVFIVCDRGDRYLSSDLFD